MNDEMTTKPTMETLLARMNEWGANLTSELAEIKAGLEDLRKGWTGCARGRKNSELI